MKFSNSSIARNLFLAFIAVIVSFSGVAFAQTETSTTSTVQAQESKDLTGQELKMPIVERATETADGKFDKYNGKKVTITGAIVIAGRCNRFTGKCEDPTFTQNGMTVISAKDWFSWITNNTGDDFLAIRFIVEPGKTLRVQLPVEGLEELKSLYMRFGRETSGVTTSINAVFKSQVGSGLPQYLANVMWLRSATESTVTHHQASIYADGLRLGESNNLGSTGAKVWTPGTPNALDFKKIKIGEKEYEETYISFITLPDWSRHNSVVVTIEFHNNTNADAMLTILGGAQIVPQQ